MFMYVGANMFVFLRVRKTFKYLLKFSDEFECKCIARNGN